MHERANVLGLRSTKRAIKWQQEHRKPDARCPLLWLLVVVKVDQSTADKFMRVSFCSGEARNANFGLRRGSVVAHSPLAVEPEPGAPTVMVSSVCDLRLRPATKCFRRRHTKMGKISAT